MLLLTDIAAVDRYNAGSRSCANVPVFTHARVRQEGLGAKGVGEAGARRGVKG